MTRRLFRNKVLLLVCDIQDKFAPKTYQNLGAIEASSMMTKVAKIFNIPILITEHNKKVFGDTVPQIKKIISQGKDVVIQKHKFSMIIPQMQEILKKHSERNQIILIGMQTHLYLKARNYEVFLPVDAITSIRAWQRTIALNRMMHDGAILTSFQSATFQLLGDSKDEKFKQVLAIIKQSNRVQAISHL